MCETRMGDIFDDPPGCRGGAGHDNGPEFGEETDCVSE